MSWLTGSEAPWTMVLGGLMILSAWLVWRSHRWGATSRARDPIAEARTALEERTRADPAPFNELEVRLHEVRREVEAIVDTKLRLLERLSRDADRQIDRLRAAVTDARRRSNDPFEADDPNAVLRIDGTSPEPSPEVAEMIELLHQSGFDAVEIARLVDRPVALVSDVLDLGDSDLSDAA